jgi:hypothetical protein
MTRLVEVALRLLDHLRRMVGTGLHEALDRGLSEAVALPAGQLTRRNGRRRYHNGDAGSKQKTKDCRQVIHDRLVPQALPTPNRLQLPPADQ